MDNRKVCVIVGANSEIGIEIAKQIKKEYKLLLCWHTHNSRILNLVDDMTTRLFQADLQNESHCIRLYDYCLNEFGRIDALINCIGLNEHSDNINENAWDRIISANLKPVFFLSKHFLSYFTRYSSTNVGRIVNFSSTAGINPNPTSPHYCAAKAGVIALTKYYAKLYAPYVTVNSVAPGFVATSNHCTAKYDSIKSQIPLQRMANVEEIAQSVCYILNSDY